MREGVPQLSYFGIEPALATAMVRQMRFEYGPRIHLGAAFFAFGSAQNAAINRNDFRVAFRVGIHFCPPLVNRRESKVYATDQCSVGMNDRMGFFDLWRLRNEISRILTVTV